MPLSKGKLESLIARTRDIVVGTDADGRVTFYNDGAKRSLGYTPDEVLGEFVARFYPSVEEAQNVMRAMREPGNGGKGIVETFQTTFLSKSDEEIPVAISGTIIYDEEGNEDGTIGFAKDLREILRKDKLATLGEVAVGLSHEINNPLAVVLNQIELLEREVIELAGDDDSSVEVERLDAMRREVARISDILGRLGAMVEREHYETIDYVGPTKMIDLRSEREKNPLADRRLHGFKILVADDDLGICSTMKELLTAAGCSTETVTDGEQALRRLETSDFDLVLTDVVMPKMDGYALYQAIQKDHPHLPVLMMTAFHYDKDHIIKRSRMQGLEGVIFKKPVDPERLCQAIYDTIKAGGSSSSS